MPDKKTDLPHATEPFVGRDPELSRLSDVFDDAENGNGHMVLLVGEPGVGKTSIAEEFASLAADRGAEVLWGRCYEGEGAPFYWPWIEVIRSYLDRHTSDEVSGQMKRGASAIADVVPQVVDLLGEIPELPKMEDPVSARFRFFDATTTFLVNASKDQPIVIVLDDLHWADGPSLLLLEFMAHQLRQARLLVVGTYRDVEVRRTHPLLQTLGELNRERLVEKLSIRGLDRDAVETYVEAASGPRRAAIEETASGEPESERQQNDGATNQAPSGEDLKRIADAVFKQSEGNPLFMTETVRLLNEERVLGRIPGDRDAPIHLPDGIREAIGRRLNRMSRPCNLALTTASVIGRDFRIDLLLELIGDEDEDTILQSLEEALGAGLIQEAQNEYGLYRFNHALTQQTLMEELSLTRRTRLHARIAETMERLYGGEAGSHAIEMVEHFANAETVLGTEKLVHYLLLAGQESLDRYAHEQALEYFERGLEAKDGKADDTESADLNIGLGRAQMAMLDDRATDSLRRAFEIAERLDDRGRMVVSATFVRLGPFMPDNARDWLEIACSRCLDLVPERSPQAAMLLGSLAGFCYVREGDYEKASRMFTDAIEIARENNERSIEQRVLAHWSSVALFALKNEEAVAHGERALALARDLGDLRGEALALNGISGPLLRLGDPRGFELIEEEVAIAERLHDRGYLISAYFRAGTAKLTAAKIAAARTYLNRADAIAEASMEPRAPITDMRFLGVSFEEGDIEAALDYARSISSRAVHDRIAPWSAGSLARYAYLSGDSRMRAITEPVMAGGFEDRSPAAEAEDAAWRARVWWVALTGDAEEASELYREGMRRDRPDVSRSQLMGVVARVAGMLDEACDEFEKLHEPLRRSGRWHPALWNSYLWSEALIDRNAPRDVSRAVELLERNIEEALERGLRLLERRSRELLSSIQRENGGEAKPEHPYGLTDREVEVLRLVATGMTNKEIGEALFISVKTVNTHLGNIFSKAGLSNRAEATAFAIRSGIVTDS